MEEYEVKDSLLAKYHKLVKQLWGYFEEIQLKQIPCENTKTNELSKLDLNDLKGNKRILIEYMGWPSTKTKPEILFIDPPDWRSLIISNLKEWASLSSDPQSTKPKIRASKYILISDILYVKSLNMPYLHCLGCDEADYVLRETYEGIYGQHLRERALVHKALR